MTGITLGDIHLLYQKQLNKVMFAHKKSRRPPPPASLTTVYILLQIQKTPLSLDNYYLCCEDNLKFSTLLSFLRANSEGKKMIFFSTCAVVEYFGKVIATILKNTKVNIQNQLNFFLVYTYAFILWRKKKHLLSNS